MLGAPVIWLVDDDDLLRQALTATLEDAGFKVVQFSGSMAPLDREPGAAIDLLIADVKLGVGQPHGVALVSMMRARRRELPCMLITAHDDIADDVGDGVTLLRKPLDLETLVPAIRALLRR